jgi:2-dehydropantoate 2-reductase
MRILVAGIGGVGGWMAGALAAAGADVSLYARGRTFVQLQENGLRVIKGEREARFDLPVIGGADPSVSFDVIICSAKSQDFGVICEDLSPLFREGTEVLAAVNGLPWWFLDQTSIRLQCLDPEGRTAARLSKVTPIGAVVHASAHAREPGVIVSVKSDRLLLGMPWELKSKHIRALAAAFEAGGIRTPIVENIREEIWAKLWGNMNMNPISALTQLSSLPILERPELRGLVRDMMNEFDALGRKLGLALPMSADERIDITRKLGDFRTSMYADAMARRRLEHEGILGCVVELAEKINVDMPVSKVVYALLKGLDHSFKVAAKL